MVAMPSGTVTFLFTDIEGSTARCEAIRGRSADAVRHAMEQNRIATAKRTNLKARTMMLSVFGAAALAARSSELGALLVGGGLEAAPEDLDPNDPLDNLYQDHVISVLRATFDPVQLRRWLDLGRRHDWEPWLRAIAELNPEAQMVDDRFVVPYPEMIAAAAEQ